MGGLSEDGADVDPAAYGERIADVYDDMHFVVDRESELAATVDFLQARAGAGPVLELGIGTGRVALPLAARGVAVVGIDASPRMLDRLRAKPGGRDLPVAVGDFADVDAPGGPFGLAYVVFNTFFALCSQDAQVRCFANVATALRPGGAFVVEAFVPDPARFDRGQRVEAVDIAGETTRVSVSVHDQASQRVRAHHLVLGPEGVHTYPVDLRYAWPSELDLMARLAGLERTERWADWAGRCFTSRSISHVSVWRKPES
jgi:SAM-dependent methyltransferase